MLKIDSCQFVYSDLPIYDLDLNLLLTSSLDLIPTYDH